MGNFNNKEDEMKTWIRHFADVRPKLGIVQVVEQTYEGNHPHFKRKRIKTRVVAEVPLTAEIPKKEYERTTEQFDQTAIQSSDRFYSTTETYLAYDKDVIEQLKSDALKGFNIEPVELIIR